MAMLALALVLLSATCRWMYCDARTLENSGEQTGAFTSYSYLLVYA